MNAATDTPSATDLAHPMERYTSQGVTVTVLRQYWRERPNMHPAPWPGLCLAHWRDGTVGVVPADASGALLAHYYFGTRIVREAML